LERFDNSIIHARSEQPNSAFKLNLGTGGNYRVIHGLPPESSLFIKIIDPGRLLTGFNKKSGVFGSALPCRQTINQNMKTQQREFIFL
jgi:hypothetical protein